MMKEILPSNTINFFDTIQIDFILSHFSEPIFPRFISTYKTQGRQFEVFNKEQMIKAYRDSDFIDCRVNAYPSYTDYKGIQRYPPNFIFADLDLSTLGSKERLEKALSASLSVIRSEINGNPTVLWTGNGYHIYQPVDAPIFEQLERFSKFKDPSLKFIRFAESFLTRGKSDPSHNPSFKSCLIRMPDSYNSKYDKDNVIKIIQKWNGLRPPIHPLLGSYHIYLVEERIKEVNLQKRTEKRYGLRSNQGNTIYWIETLLLSPIEDYRKNGIDLILGPYLINIRKISYDESFSIIKEWLVKCNKFRHLDPNFDYRIKVSLYRAMRKQTVPMKLDTLRTKNRFLYDLLRKKMIKDKAVETH